MTNLNDVLLAMSNIPVDDPIAEIWGRGLQGGGYTIIEYTGALPITINANGKPLIDYRIYGNTEQTGTPTPENPIIPIGCGERTENLFDVSDFTYSVGSGSQNRSLWSGTLPSGTYTVSITQESTLTSSTRNTLIVGINGTLNYESPTTNYHNDAGIHSITFTVEEGDTVDIYYWMHTLSDICTFKNAILNAGSTALPYEPYGYKLPILSNSTVTNIYLGEVETTRRIKKLVLTGEETWSYYSATNAPFKLNLMDGIRLPLPTSIYWVCSHYEAVSNSVSWASYDSCISWSTADGSSGLRFRDIQYSNLDDFKNYIAQQYANGTPVTVWYVLVTPTTGIVNEPLMKIGNYSDTIDSTQANVQIPTSKGTTTIDYDGALKPSQMYIKYLGVKK